jgi:hypothetical protein
MNLSKNDILFATSLLLAIWFTLTGAVWVYWFALIFAYPAGVISFILWRKGRNLDNRSKRYKIIPIVLGIGLLLSLSTLVYLLIFD